MRPVEVQVGATGSSNWIAVDYQAAPFGIGFRCTLGGATGATGASATYGVQHAFCSMVPQTAVSITRSTTTATLTFNSMEFGGVTTNGQPHGLSITDEVRVEGAGAPLDGIFPIASIPSPKSVTYTVANSGATSNATGSTKVWRLFVGANASVTGATGSVDGNYAFPPNYIRLNVTGWTAGTVTLVMNQGAQS